MYELSKESICLAERLAISNPVLASKLAEWWADQSDEIKQLLRSLKTKISTNDVYHPPTTARSPIISDTGIWQDNQPCTQQDIKGSNLLQRGQIKYS